MKRLNVTVRPHRPPLLWQNSELCHSRGLDGVCTQLQGRDGAGSWLPSSFPLGISHLDQRFPLLTLEDSDFP